MRVEFFDDPTTAVQELRDMVRDVRAARNKYVRLAVSETARLINCIEDRAAARERAAFIRGALATGTWSQADAVSAAMLAYPVRVDGSEVTP